MGPLLDLLTLTQSSLCILCFQLGTRSYKAIKLITYRQWQSVLEREWSPKIHVIPYGIMGKQGLVPNHREFVGLIIIKYIYFKSDCNFNSFYKFVCYK